MIWGSGIRGGVGLGLWKWSSGFQSLGFRISDLEFRVKGLGFRSRLVQDSRFSAHGKNENVHC